MINNNYTLHGLFCILNKMGILVRNMLEVKYPTLPDLGGRCLEASNMLTIQLNILGISASVCSGWVLYDYPDCCSDEPCDPHSMVKVPYQGNYIYLDVTATQFQFCLSEQIPKVLISTKCPYWFVESDEKPLDILKSEYPEWY